MNSKKAKALRKEIGFHPRAKRAYIAQLDYSKGKPVVVRTTAVAAPESLRGRYLAAKKAAA